MNHQQTTPVINTETILDSNREIIIDHPMPKIKREPLEPSIYYRSQDQPVADNKIPNQNWENHTYQPRHASTASVPFQGIYHLIQTMGSFSNSTSRNSTVAALSATVATTPVTALISLIC